MDWQIPLLVSAIVFAVYVAYRFRPAFGEDGRATAAALEEARKRIEAAKDDGAKARALADAADACARLRRTNSAVGFYLRALRADPGAAEIVERAAAALARRPIALEKLMWRHLGFASFAGDGRDAALASLRVLAEVYHRRPRTEFRARAVEHLLEALEPKA